MTALRAGLVAGLAILLLAFAPSANAQTPPPPDAKKEEARSHFDLGLFHFDRQEWAAALAEFLRARELFPTRSATKNAAICLHKEHRFDEALEMFEGLLRDYPDLSPADRALADAEIAELRSSVGTLSIDGAEPGAAIVVDGRALGTYPLPAPLRLGVGSHVVRVVKEGFVPFERRVDVASGQAGALAARLVALTRSGRLRVVEQGGRSLDVIVDNVVVGKTPWEGSVAPGDHSVLLRGEGDLGTPPMSAPVAVDAETPVTLLATELDATARVEPTPGGALVRIDGVAVGRGVWESRLPSGPHRIDATDDGYWPATRNVRLGPRDRQVIQIALERDPSSPLWGARARPHLVFGLDTALALTPVRGGQVQDSCSGGCSASLPLGGLGLVTATYQLPQGLGFGVEGGYLRFSGTLLQRDAQITGSALRATDSGTVNDLITASGVVLAGTLVYRHGDTWPLTLRVAVGAFLSTVRDDREGLFTTSSEGRPPGAPYAVGLTESHGAALVYAAPELRVGRRLSENVEVDAGLKIMVLTAPSPASWTDQTPVLAGPRGTQGDGLGKFGTQTLTGTLLLVVAPGIGARYAF